MMAKSESSVRHTAVMERPLLNVRSTSYWRDRWWLLDVETGGLDCQEDDIISLRLACMEDYRITEERESLVRPRRPLSPWAEKLTGISNRSLERAASLDEAIGLLEGLDWPLLFLDRGFTLPFLQNAWLRCGRTLSHPCLLLDRLAAQLLDCSPKKKADEFLKMLPQPEGLDSTPPRGSGLDKLYELSMAVFQHLEQAYRVQNTAQLAELFGQEDCI